MLNRERIRYIVYPVVLAWLLTSWVRPIYSDGAAMLPTIGDGQVIIVEKTAYNRIHKVPKLYDVVAFRKDFAPTEDEGANTIRRVIGGPGDIVQIKNGIVYNNGKPLDESNYALGTTEGDIGPLTVGEDEVFVLGDNRIESIDSRGKDIGLLKTDLIRGKAILRIWPINELAKIR